VSNSGSCQSIPLTRLPPPPNTSTLTLPALRLSFPLPFPPAAHVLLCQPALCPLPAASLDSVLLLRTFLRRVIPGKSFELGWCYFLVSAVSGYFANDGVSPQKGLHKDRTSHRLGVIGQRKGIPVAGPRQTLFPCLLNRCSQICHSATDLARQCLRHRAPEFSCLGCRYSFTRPDALKRHRAAVVASEV
jgi:hypothetical protein